MLRCCVCRASFINDLFSGIDRQTHQVVHRQSRQARLQSHPGAPPLQNHESRQTKNCRFARDVYSNPKPPGGAPLCEKKQTQPQERKRIRLETALIASRQQVAAPKAGRRNTTAGEQRGQNVTTRDRTSENRRARTRIRAGRSLAVACQRQTARRQAACRQTALAARRCT
jgi:hypothetical protein